MQTATATESKVRIFDSFRHRNFTLLTIGRITSNSGRAMRILFRGWLVLQITDSPLWLGIISGALAIPMLFVPFIGGVVADRMDRRKLLLITESLLVALWVVVSVLVTMGMITEWHLLFTAIVSGAVQSFGRPAHQAVVPNVVSKEHFMNAISLDSAGLSASNILGPALAGMLVSVIGVGGGFWLTSFLQFITVITLIMMKWDMKIPATSKQSFSQNFVEGIRFMRSDVVILALIGMASASTLFVSPYSAMMPVFARDVLNVGSSGLGILMSVTAVGSLTGALCVAMLGNFRRKGLLQVGAAFIQAGMLFTFAYSTNFSFSLVTLAGVGFLSMVFQTINNTLLQLVAPEHFRGRIMSARIVVMGLMPVGMIPMGALAEAMGAPFTVALGGILFGLSVLAIVLTVPRLRQEW